VIDVIRGLALCGLPLIHALEFGFSEVPLSVPDELSPGDQFFWYVVAIFAVGKFISLFGLLFGAGIVLATRRADDLGQPVAARFSRRFGVLFLIGLMHAYLIWYGDILVPYALIGFLVFWGRRWSIRWLCSFGVVLLAVFPLTSLLLGLLAIGFEVDLSGMTEDDAETEKFDEWWKQSFEGGWLEQMPARALAAFVIQLVGIPLYLVWFSGGLMFLGMAGARTGYLLGEKSVGLYRKLALICVPAGLLLGVIGKIIAKSQMDRTELLMTFLFVGYGAILVTACGYLNLLLWWSKRSPGGAVWNSLADVGQMALSNYLLQSILFGLIFHGHGLGLSDELPYGVVLLVCPILWLIGISVSRWWLDRYRFGPVEWLWRRLTYLRPVPNRRVRE